MTHQDAQVGRYELEVDVLGGNPKAPIDLDRGEPITLQLGGHHLRLSLRSELTMGLTVQDDKQQIWQYGRGLKSRKCRAECCLRGWVRQGVFCATGHGHDAIVDTSMVVRMVMKAAMKAGAKTS